MGSSHGRILVVEQDQVVGEGMQSLLESQGFVAVVTRSGEDALDAAQRSHFDVVLVDPQLRGLGGNELLRKIKEVDPEALIAITSGFSTVAEAAEAMKAGAFDYLPKPVRSEELILVVKRAFERIGQAEIEGSSDETGFAGIVGRSAPMQEVFETIRKVRDSKSTVLIEGESGTGKELVARAIHEQSRRRAFPFISVHCSAVPTDLLESELFGHEKGSFTTALRRQKGKFELADGGTLLLDEIATLGERAQVDLLRVLQERSFTRIGGSEVISTNARVIATSNQTLRELVVGGSFRQDLYYRLNVVRIVLPPLRERQDDIPLLAHHFLEKHRDNVDRRVTDISDSAIEVLCQAPWQGNIRELENAIERAIVMGTGNEIQPWHLPPEILDGDPDVAGGLDEEENLNLPQRVEALETKLIKRALAATQTRADAADRLGINERTLRYKMKNHRIEGPRSPAASRKTRA